MMVIILLSVAAMLFMALRFTDLVMVVNGRQADRLNPQGRKQWDGLLLTYRHHCAKLVIAPPVNGENGGVHYED